MTPRSPARLEYVAPLLVAALTIAFSVRPLDDFDTWYHLAAGRLMWATWSWPTTNTFAFTTPDHPWIDLHWIFQLLLYASYAVGGPNGCIALTTLLMLATVGLLYADARRFAPPALVAVLLATALVIASPRFVPRPELLSFILFAAYLFILDDYPRCGKMIYLLVPLQILWTNAQGIFVIGLALIGCYWAGATASFLPLPRGWREENGCTPAEWRRLTLVLILAAAACFLNPYGVEGVRFPLQLLPSVTGSSIFSARIGEFRSPFKAGYAVPLAYTWAIFLAVAILSFLVRLRRLHMGRLLAVAAFGYLSTQALRNMALFAWIAVPAVAANLGPLFAGRTPVPLTQRAERRRGTTRESRLARAGPMAAAAGAVAVVALLVTAVVTNRFYYWLGIEHGFGAGVSRLRFPIEGVEFARRVGIGGRPFNCLATGGYLTWMRFPEERVFVDGRLEAFPEQFFRTYFQAMDDPASWPTIEREYHPDYVLLYHVWSNRHPLARYLARGNGWTLVYYDETTSLFLPVTDTNRDVRARAQQEFATLQSRRSREPPRVPGSVWRAVVLPIEEPYRQSAYGDFLRAMGQHTEAIEAYKRALVLDPDDSATRFSLAMAYWFAGNRSQSTLELRDILRRDPRHEHAARALEEAQAAMRRSAGSR